MGTWPVSEAKQRELARSMERLGLTESDLAEDFVRGSGPGGQKINKTSVAVQLTHLPSGIQVRCQKSRSQAMNRFLARRLLVEKLTEKILGEKAAKRKEIEKIRRQKRRRSRRAKEKMLAAKRHQATKKALRQRVTATMIFAFLLLSSCSSGSQNSQDNNGNDETPIDTCVSDTTGESATFSVIATRTSEQTTDNKNPVVAVAADGAFAVAWGGKKEGTEGTFARVFDPTGTPLGGEFLVEAMTGIPEHNPSIGFLPDGSVVVKWDELVAELADHSDVDINFKILDRLGNVIVATTSVDKGATAKSSESEMAIDEGGTIYFIWVDERNGTAELFARSFSSDGAARTEPTRIDASEGDPFMTQTEASCGDETSAATSTRVYFPSLAIGPSGNLFAIWKDEKGWITAEEQEVMVASAFTNLGRIVDPSFNAAGDEFQVDQLGRTCQNHHESANNWLPSVTARNDTGWTAAIENITYAYNDPNHGEPSEFWMQMSTTHFVKFRDLEIFDENNPPSPLGGSIEAHLLIRPYNDDGKPLADTLLVDQGSGIYLHPFSRSHEFKYHTAFNSNNVGLIVWSDLRNGGRDLYGRKFDCRGTFLGDDFLIRSNAESPFIAPDPLADYRLVWIERSDGAVYSSN